MKLIKIADTPGISKEFSSSLMNILEYMTEAVKQVCPFASRMVSKSCKFAIIGVAPSIVAITLKTCFCFFDLAKHSPFSSNFPDLKNYL